MEEGGNKRGISKRHSRLKNGKKKKTKKRKEKLEDAKTLTPIVKREKGRGWQGGDEKTRSECGSYIK